MTDPAPEIVASANLSPLSPAPIPIHSSSPALVPALQDSAEYLDVATLDSLMSHHPAPMASDQEAPGVSDTIIVRGDYSDDSPDGSMADSDSFDAYGEDEEMQEQDDAPDAGVAGNDDYARAFESDSPLTGHSPTGQAETEGAEPDVSKASSISMNSSPASDSLLGQDPSARPAAAAAALSPSAELSTTEDSVENAFSPPKPSTEPEVSRGSLAPPEVPEGSTSSVAAEPAQPAQPAQPAAQPVQPAQPVQSVQSVQSTQPAQSAKSDAVEGAKAHDTTRASTTEQDGAALNIQKLVDDIASRVETASVATSPVTPSQQAQPPPATSAVVQPALNVSQPSSLPPKPNLPSRQPGQPTALLPNSSLPQPPNSVPHLPPATQAGLPHLVAGAPGTTSDAGSSSLPPPPPPASFGSSQAYASFPNAVSVLGAGAAPANSLHSPSTERDWDMFQADEKRYMSEAKWERFPEGSRIFIGNLSSERVSKREVFNVFNKFGRLAQISLKNAYGFVQYHLVEDAEKAMQNAQGAELGGRKIHLEVSRTQKKKDDRERSPPERKTQNRGARADRYDGREQGRRGRDDYRPARSPSPRRHDGRGGRESFGRDRDHRSSFDRRGRSRSPQRPGRLDDNPYRRRSPSPPRYEASGGDQQVDLPRRYGNDVPDVQLLLLQELQRDFVDWVQRPFRDSGLTTDVMYLNPRFPRDALLQRHILEGVHGIIELDHEAQRLGRISIQVFNRSGGPSVRFDRYENIEPTVAVQLVIREKAQTAALMVQGGHPPNAYVQPYQLQSTPVGYPYPNLQPAYAPPQPPPQAQTGSIQDIVNIVGNLDQNSLQQLLASLQGGQGGPAIPGMPPSMQHMGMPPANPTTQNAQFDINALLGTLKSATGAGPLPAAGVPGPTHYGAPAVYGSIGNASVANPPGFGMNGVGGSDTAQQVQSIMDKLARFRQ